MIYNSKNSMSNYSEPSIEWSEGPNPYARVRYNGQDLPCQAYFPPSIIKSEDKYPLLYEDADHFNITDLSPWRARGLSVRIRSVCTKILYDVNVKLFSKACNIMTEDIRGRDADDCLESLKRKIRPYFRCDDQSTNMRGLLPIPITTECAPSCVGFMSNDWHEFTSLHLCFAVDGAVTLVNIDFGRTLCDEMTMCGTERMNVLFGMLQDCGALPHDAKHFDTTGAACIR
jgi:hypothetical protein